jgi:hypothetical protein
VCRSGDFRDERAALKILYFAFAASEPSAAVVNNLV